MKKYSVPFDESPSLISKWHRTVGKPVYKLSGKPFKSKQHQARPTGIVIHPITNRHAFTFNFVGIVECRMCELHLEDPSKWTHIEQHMLDQGVDCKTVHSIVSRHITHLLDLPDSVEDRDEALIAYKQLESHLNKLVAGELV